MHRNRIKYWRHRRGLSQQELGLRLGGMTQPNVSRIEQDEQNLTEDLMTRIAEALDVAPIDLLPIAVVAGLKNDLAPETIKAEPGVAAVLHARGLVSYRVLTDSVANKGPGAGCLAIVDTARRDVSALQDGDLVAAIVRNPAHPSGSFTVLRQFVGPDSFTTNKPGPGANIMFRISDDWITVEIVGVVVPQNGQA